MARERHAKVDIYKVSFRPLKNTGPGRDAPDVDADSDCILGCHVPGPDAAEIVQMTAIAMRMKATKADFDSTTALHPSAAAELMTLRDKWVPPVKPTGAENQAEVTA